jgi:NADH-quinone oxidoreductase subunit L
MIAFWIAALIGLPFLGFTYQFFLGKKVIALNAGNERDRMRANALIFFAIDVLLAIFALIFSDPITALILLIALPIPGVFGLNRNKNQLFGKEPRSWLGIMSTAIVFLCFIITLFLYKEKAQTVSLLPWIDLQSLKIPLEFRIDSLSITMALIVTGIGGLIHLYSMGYMAKDKDYSRYFSYLNLFIGFMLILVMSGNLVTTFIGWEGVGLCSYLLIGFWYKDLNNTRAGSKAFIMNRIGDLGFLIGMFLLVVMMWNQPDARKLSFDVILPKMAEIFQNQPILAAITALCFFLAAVGKSAQFPLYTWLPDAMAGPTPVSALIHAATMVTAGIFLLARMHSLFDLSSFDGAVIALIGAFTSLWAAIIAFGQTDIKKVLAYSTVSQLGYMFVACGVGVYWVGIFHVVTHAFFKALLFLGSGSVIYGMRHEQDMRRYGNLWRYMPATATTMYIGAFAISGLPFLSGYWSKEAILASEFESGFAVIGNIQLGQWVGWIGLIVAALTTGYMFRMMFLTFGIPGRDGEERWRNLQPEHPNYSAHKQPQAVLEINSDLAHYYHHEMVEQTEEDHHALNAEHTPKESPLVMTIPLMVLAALSLVGGFWLHQNHLLEHYLFSSIPDSARAILHVHAGSFVIQALAGFSIAAFLIGFTYAVMTYSKGLPKKEAEDMALWNPVRRAALNQFGYDRLLVSLFSRFGEAVSKFIWQIVDIGIIDGAVKGVSYVAAGLGGLARKIQTGYARTYAMVMFIGVIGLLSYTIYILNSLSGGR